LTRKASGLSAPRLPTGNGMISGFVRNHRPVFNQKPKLTRGIRESPNSMLIGAAQKENKEKPAD
jgi:hypothetical protein